MQNKLNDYEKEMEELSGRCAELYANNQNLAYHNQKFKKDLEQQQTSAVDSVEYQNLLNDLEEKNKEIEDLWAKLRRYESQFKLMRAEVQRMYLANSKQKSKADVEAILSKIVVL